MSDKGTLVASAPYGNGEILFLADPYVISNGGIGLADNARLAVNLVTRKNGIIAFDEYHQGYGEASNRFLGFFAGTPVIAIFLQVCVLLGAVFYSQSRRFARPLPPVEPDRLSTLEYVSAMAELQQRARAYDLAIENIYSSFHRRAIRSLGLDGARVKTRELARAVAERIGLDVQEVSELLETCEETIRGESANSHETLEVIAKLRVVEQKLGFGRSGATAR